MSRQFYAYIYYDPRNDTPFYVGKGFGRRAWKHLSCRGPNRILCNKITGLRRVGLEPTIEILNTISEAHAFLLERALIDGFGRRDLGRGPLVNYTDGGEGSAGRRGFRHTETTKKHLSNKLKGRTISPEHRAKIGAANSGRSGPSHETQMKMIAARRTPEARKRNSETQKRNFDPARQQALSLKGAAATRGKKQTPELVAKRMASFAQTIALRNRP